MNDEPVRIQFALVSHTNAGKTTLARTLVGVDVGEVRDAPHVTVVSEAHTLLRTDAGDQLLLWDTPGFGDSVRLFKRLRQAGNPIGWFLSEVVDRYRDRPFWLSQQAVRTVRDSADLVLYLVNSSEDPNDAGYLASEMKILQWMGKPVVILLNQIGPPRQYEEEAAEQTRWKNYLASYSVVRDVLPLDAFARCWVHERVFYQAVAKLLPPNRQAAYARLLAVWERQNQTRLQAAMALIASQVLNAAKDSEPIDTEQGAVFGAVLSAVGLNKARDQRRQNKAMTAMMARLNTGTLATTAGLLKLHRLDAAEAKTINERVLKGFVVRAPIDRKQASLIGAALSGAATGLSADLMAGGLTFGAGALVGAIVGAMTFAGAASVFNATTDRKDARVEFSDDFLQQLLITGLLRYLAVAHFGRGRGNFVESEAPGFWQQEVEAELAQQAAKMDDVWRANTAPEAAVAKMTAALEQATTRILERLYPNTPVLLPAAT
jgi:Domain of unknown function (DUF3482)/50S ribosome-binding GTPase